jgi:hypothetical protein
MEDRIFDIVTDLLRDDISKNEAIDKLLILYNVSGSTYGKCKHINKKEIYRDYPDAYIEYECLDCGERIFEDMYNN